MASTRSAAASRTCSQLSNTNSRTRPSCAAARLSLTLLPGGWVTPSTAAAASGTAAGSPTARVPDPAHPDRSGQVPQPPLPQIVEIDSTEQTRRRIGHQDLSTVSGGHRPSGAVEHGSEVVPVAQLSLPSRQSQPHRQLNCSLRRDRGLDRRHRRGERRHHAVTRVAEQVPPCSSIAMRNTSSCLTSATRTAAASDSHRRVEPSISVNRNVTPPKVGPRADTCTKCHTKPCSTRQS